MKKIIFSVIILNLLFSQVLTDNTFNNVQSISLSGAVISNPNDNFNPANLLETKETSILVGKTLYYEQKLIQITKLLNLEDIQKYYSELSDGQKRKVLIARSMINNPDILILDEPIANLDLKSR